jgi:putative ABC transport system permease protein
LKDFFNDQFNSDREFVAHMGLFTFIAVIIASLGLLGLVSFSVERRLKEIAVRKVLGCSGGRIIYLLSFDFLKWIIVANIIAWPAGYLCMKRWLEDFTYRCPLILWPFFISGVAALVIAFLTISVQSYRASRANPVDILRLDI